jgi:molecular chaperone GrpE
VSGDRKQGNPGLEPGGDAATEAEEVPAIATSDEMEAALREAAEAVDERRRGPDAGEISPDKMTIEMLSQELQSLKEEFEARCKELEEANDRHARLQAEFENFRRRNLKERQESLQYGHQNLVKDLLSTVDNLERAVGHTEQSDDVNLESVLQGVALVQREFLAALGKQGVKEIDPAGEPFDPTFHEAMGQVPDSAVAANTVVQVLQKGYLLQDRMLRPARVMVARAPGPGEGGGEKN